MGIINSKDKIQDENVKAYLVDKKDNKNIDIELDLIEKQDEFGETHFTFKIPDNIIGLDKQIQFKINYNGLVIIKTIITVNYKYEAGDSKFLKNNKVYKQRSTILSNGTLYLRYKESSKKIKNIVFKCNNQLLKAHFKWIMH